MPDAVWPKPNPLIRAYRTRNRSLASARARKVEDVGVVMMVKNESRRIENALAPIMDQLAQVIVFDTGSNDGTQDLLRERLRVEPIPARLDPKRCFSHADLRNRGLAMLDTPWCMTMDADEQLDPKGFRELKNTKLPENTDGLFLRWRNELESGEVFDDYKCALFRKGIRKLGLIHDNVQPAIRLAATRAAWSDAVMLLHRPEAYKDEWKRQFYNDRLTCAMHKEPENPRYHWFAGYAALHEGRATIAEKWLGIAAESTHPLYPVERINARVVLTALAASKEEVSAATKHLHLAAQLFENYREDFEVQVNKWLKPWLLDAEIVLSSGNPRALHAPRFAH